MAFVGARGLASSHTATSPEWRLLVAPVPGVPLHGATISCAVPDSDAGLVHGPAGRALLRNVELRLLRRVGILWTGASNVDRALTHMFAFCPALHLPWSALRSSRGSAASLRPAPPPVCRMCGFVDLHDGCGRIALIQVYAVYAVAFWVSALDRPYMLRHAKRWAGCVDFEWQAVTARGFRFCALHQIEAVLPEDFRLRSSGPANGAVWLPNVNGRCYGVIAVAPNREDFERASALAGAVAMVCFFDKDCGPLDALAPAACLTRDIFARERH